MARSTPMDHESADRISAAASREPESPTATRPVTRIGAGPHLDERQRRLYLGSEARSLGHGGIEAVARAAGG